MAINFLQTRNPPILPCLNDMYYDTLKTNPNAVRQVIIDGIDCSFFDDLPTLQGFGARNTQSLGALLYSFFRYYAFEFNYDVEAISVRLGRRLSKKEKGWHVDIERFYRFLCIEEPFNPSRNLGNSADQITLVGLRIEFQRALHFLFVGPCERICAQYIPNRFFNHQKKPHSYRKARDTMHHTRQNFVPQDYSLPYPSTSIPVFIPSPTGIPVISRSQFIPYDRRVFSYFPQTAHPATDADQETEVEYASPIHPASETVASDISASSRKEWRSWHSDGGRSNSDDPVHYQISISDTEHSAYSPVLSESVPEEADYANAHFLDELNQLKILNEEKATPDSESASPQSSPGPQSRKTKRKVLLWSNVSHRVPHSRTLSAEYQAPVSDMFNDDSSTSPLPKHYRANRNRSESLDAGSYAIYSGLKGGWSPTQETHNGIASTLSSPGEPFYSRNTQSHSRRWKTSSSTFTPS
jgi:hypothetical protein